MRYPTYCVFALGAKSLAGKASVRDAERAVARRVKTRMMQVCEIDSMELRLARPGARYMGIGSGNCQHISSLPFLKASCQCQLFASSSSGSRGVQLEYWHIPGSSNDQLLALRTGTSSRLLGYKKYIL